MYPVIKIENHDKNIMLRDGHELFYPINNIMFHVLGL